MSKFEVILLIGLLFCGSCVFGKEVNCEDKINKIACCNYDIIDPNHEKIKNCEKSIKGDPELAATHCKIVECVFKDLNVYKNKEIQKDGVQKILDEIKDENTKKIVKGLSDFCFTETMKNKEKIIKVFQEEHKINPEECDVIPTMLSICITLETEKQCPEPFRNKTEACDANYKLYEKCGDKYTIFKELEL